MRVEWTVTTHSAAETQALAARLAARLIAGDVLWLSGDLGAGKTTFSQGLGRGLGIQVPINSPTFVLIREYGARLPLYHIDLYRLENPRDIATLGLNDYLNDDGVCAVEWADRLVGPDTTLSPSNASPSVERTSGTPEEHRSVNEAPGQVGVDRMDEALWPGLYVRIEPCGETARELRFSAVGARAERLLAEWKQSEEAHAASH